MIDYDKELQEQDYEFLGWQNGWKHIYLDRDRNPTIDPKEKRYFDYAKEDYPKYRNCIDSKHETWSFSKDSRGTEETTVCDLCQIYWKVDSSD